jgi:hypothetical protein
MKLDTTASFLYSKPYFRQSNRVHLNEIKHLVQQAWRTIIYDALAQTNNVIFKNGYVFSIAAAGRQAND